MKAFGQLSSLLLSPLSSAIYIYIYIFLPAHSFLSKNYCILERGIKEIMEAMKMKMKMLIVVLMIINLAVSGIKVVSAADAPAPSPASDASIFVPTLFASFALLLFSFLY